MMSTAQRRIATVGLLLVASLLNAAGSVFGALYLVFGGRSRTGAG